MIAFDAVTNGGTQSSTGPLNFSHTCSGSNRILFVVAFGGDASDVVTGITYNGVAMTFINKVKGSVNHYSYLYYLVAPATGSNTVSISYSGNHFMSGGAISYTGAKQTGQPDASTTTTDAGASITANLTTTADNCWGVLIAAANGDVSASTGSTERTNTGISWDIFDSNGALTPAGSKSMSATGPSGMAAIMVSFSPPGDNYTEAPLVTMVSSIAQANAANRIEAPSLSLALAASQSEQTVCSELGRSLTIVGVFDATAALLQHIRKAVLRVFSSIPSGRSSAVFPRGNPRSTTPHA